MSTYDTSVRYGTFYTRYNTYRVSYDTDNYALGNLENLNPCHHIPFNNYEKSCMKFDFVGRLGWDVYGWSRSDGTQHG